ncbi:MAG: class F sortase, partial [Dehalococcoidia bacterium]
MRALDARRAQLIILTMIAAAAMVVAVLTVTGALEGGGGIRLQQGEEEVLVGEGVGDQGASEGIVADSVEAFSAEFGEPPDATYGRIRIPAISVDAPLTYRMVESLMMPDPAGPVDVAYYDLSNFPGMGGVPGQGGNAVFAGHVDLNRDIDYAGGEHYQGPAVFWSLDALGPGHIIELDVDGETLTYEVVSTESLAADSSTDWARVWSADVEADTITLFTCGGSFDAATHEYT